MARLMRSQWVESKQISMEWTQLFSTLDDYLQVTVPAHIKLFRDVLDNVPEACHDFGYTRQGVITKESYGLLMPRGSNGKIDKRGNYLPSRKKSRAVIIWNKY